MTPIDVTFHCREQHGRDATASPISGSIQWQCNVKGQADPVEPFVDLDTVCAEQVCVGARAESLNSSSAFEWRCVFEFRLDEVAPDECAIEPGEALAGLALPDGLPDAMADAWPDDTASCPASFVRRIEGGYIQELGPVGGVPTAAIFAAADRDPIYLDGGPWRAWERLVAVLPSAFGGIPVTGPELVGDTYTVELSSTSVLVAGDLGDEFYPIVTFVYPLWIDSGGRNGCLGLPIADPSGDASGYRQDYERGSAQLDLAGSGRLIFLDQNGLECQPTT